VSHPPRRGELTSLDERLGLLLVVRCGVVACVVITALVARPETGVTLSQVGPCSAAYLALSGAVEWRRRGGHRGRLHVHRAMLPLDSLYLVLVTAPTGGPRSDLLFLFYVQLIAVTLLGSPRTGVRIALWDSFLFVALFTFSLQGQVSALLGAHLIRQPDSRTVTLSIMTFWTVALATAFFSSVSERELRRSKAELAALASLAVELEEATETDTILQILLRYAVDSFEFRRGVLHWGTGQRSVAYAGRPGAAGGVHVELEEVVLGRSETFDVTVLQAWAGRAPVLVRELDPGRDPTLARLLPGARNVAIIPLPPDAEQGGVLVLERGGRPGQKVPRRTLAVLEQFCTHAALALRGARLLAERERMAAVDGLTGLANRREFESALSREVNRSTRNQEALSLIVVDVDHFKEINDTRGHLAGDEVLRILATTLQEQVRDMDVVARYGGEEFAILLPACSTADARDVGERVRAAVKGRPGLMGVTVSAGVATMPTHAGDSLHLVAAADEALYRAKHQGRDRVALAERRSGRQAAS
jgi:two-component system cell cycle response regulator